MVIRYPNAGPTTQPQTKISAMAVLFRNAAITSGIRTWRPMAARFDTVKINTKGPNVV